MYSGTVSVAFPLWVKEYLPIVKKDVAKYEFKKHKFCLSTKENWESNHRCQGRDEMMLKKQSKSNVQQDAEVEFIVLLVSSHRRKIFFLMKMMRKQQCGLKI